MRKLLLLPVLLTALSGCESRPAPRKEFAETSDPKEVFNMLPVLEREPHRGRAPGPRP